MQDELLSFNDLPYVEPEAPVPRLDKSWMPLAQLILETIEDDSGALKNWVEKVVPSLLSELSLLNAKGMSLIAAEGFVSAKKAGEKLFISLFTCQIRAWLCTF